MTIVHLRCPVDNWTVRKRSKKIFQDDGGLCRVLMEEKAIIIFAFKVRGKVICLMFVLRILNCCHNSGMMSFITIPFQLPSIKCWGRCRHCSGNYEAQGASGGKYEARIVIFRILAAVDRFSWIAWKVESR